MFRKILIGYDPRGKMLANTVKKWLEAKKYDVVFAQTDGLDYVDATIKTSNMFEKNTRFDCVILICGTGVGVTMVANRFSFLRAICATSSEIAYFARRHENANCLCLPAGYDDGNVNFMLNDDELFNIISTFFDTTFEGGRHEERVKKLSTLGD